MSVLVAESFALDYESDLHLLVGQWFSTPTTASLHTSYEYLLTQATAHGNCCCWLLDMRLRNWHSPTFATWYGEQLVQRSLQALGAPVFVAYLVTEAHRAHLKQPATQASLRQSARAGFHPRFFTSEVAAFDWLRYYQGHPGQQPPLP